MYKIRILATCRRRDTHAVSFYLTESLNVITVQRLLNPWP